MKDRDQAQQSARNPVLRFLPYYRKYWRTVTLDLCCAGLTTLCELVLPLIVRTITATAT